ncbi:hypothetical protein FOZ63_028526 [Perkinsus olseni]|uniref:Uncharacterized protein n=1 Tax=Perkinsus olseni TaxID=32597 RepID=A0A7J6UAY4_PEROL|nr:hypothetical protein FOZ63_028526 [Perkinsus olseni]KAF4754350.1 hypothetical protein FOZ62_029129 [Perkinsus olseni]
MAITLTRFILMSSLLPLLTPAVSIRAVRSEVRSLRRSISVERDEKRNSTTCAVRYPALDIRVISSPDRDSRYIKAETLVNGTRYTLSYSDYRVIDTTRWSQGHNEHSSYRTGFGQAFLLPDSIIPEHPIGRLYGPIMRLLQTGGVNSTTCADVADFIEDHPGEPYKDDGVTPWIRQFLLNPAESEVHRRAAKMFMKS